MTGRSRWPTLSPGVVPENLADQKQALAWFESEHAVLLAALRHSTGFDTHIWQLAWALVSYFGYQGHWRDRRDSQAIALDAGRRLSDKPAQALHTGSWVDVRPVWPPMTTRAHTSSTRWTCSENWVTTPARPTPTGPRPMLERQGLYPRRYPTPSRHSPYSGRQDIAPGRPGA